MGTFRRWQNLELQQQKYDLASLPAEQAPIPSSPTNPLYRLAQNKGIQGGPSVTTTTTTVRHPLSPSRRRVATHDSICDIRAPDQASSSHRHQPFAHRPKPGKTHPQIIKLESGISLRGRGGSRRGLRGGIRGGFRGRAGKIVAGRLQNFNVCSEVTTTLDSAVDHKVQQQKQAPSNQIVEKSKWLDLKRTVCLLCQRKFK